MRWTERAERRRHLGRFLAAAVVLVAVVGCGSDDEPETAPVVGSTASTAVDDPTPTTEVPSSTTTSGPSDTTAAPSTTAAEAVARPTTTATSPTTARPTTTVATTSATTGAEAAIRIENFTYSPPALRVAVGTTVTATNHDAAAHTWTADDGTWDSGSMEEGERFERTFTASGTFTYRCTIHPSMRGSVAVS